MAIARLAYYKSGEILKSPKYENESKIEEVKWIKLKDLKLHVFIKDEQAVIKKFLEYIKNNPFTL